MNPLYPHTVAWNLGPYHNLLPGPMQLKMQLFADRIASCAIETGFMHRDMEKVLERKTWASLISCMDHLDPENAVHGEWVFCLAVEGLADIAVPPRAQDIRVILSELTRICSHLFFIAELARIVGAVTAMHYLLRDRERVLDLFELLTGVRFSFNFLKMGGVKSDLTEGFIERVLEVSALIELRLKEYNDLFTYNIVFMKRSVGVGTLSYEDALVCGVSGPNALASGLDLDARKCFGYSGYDQIEFTAVPQHFQKGDVHSRCLIRLHQISESIQMIKQVIHRMAPGSFLNEEGSFLEPFLYCSGESYARVETSRGLLGCHLVADKAHCPLRISLRVPSQFHVNVLPLVVRNMPIDDLAITLRSFDISMAEADK